MVETRRGSPGKQIRKIQSGKKKNSRKTQPARGKGKKWSDDEKDHSRRDLGYACWGRNGQGQHWGARVKKQPHAKDLTEGKARGASEKITKPGKGGKKGG